LLLAVLPGGLLQGHPTPPMSASAILATEAPDSPGAPHLSGARMTPLGESAPGPAFDDWPTASGLAGPLAHRAENEVPSVNPHALAWSVTPAAAGSNHRRPLPVNRPGQSPSAGHRSQSQQSPRSGTAWRAVRVRMLVTAYCPCRKCCGRFSDGRTASGKSIYDNNCMFVAADTDLLPFGTYVSIPGYYQGHPVPVEDRGRKIRGYRLDVFFLSHQQARQWGARWIDVVVYLRDDQAD
jgi:3D (Asp-Asp-Asp) domain-containing protein